jgi:hypothetical protein
VGGYAPLDYDPTDGYTNDTGTYIGPRPGVARDLIAMRQEYMNNQLATGGWNDGQFTQAFFTDTVDQEPFDDSQSIQRDTSNEALTNNSTFDSYMFYGPYDFAPGDKVKIVMTWVYGTGVTDDIYAFARSGATNLVAAQTALQNNGVTNLERNLSHAQWLYDHGYDVPDQPPDVFALVQTNTSGGVDVKWSAAVESATHPDYTGAEAQDVAGYRVYRSNGAWKGHLGPWSLVATIPKGTTPSSPDFKVAVAGGVYTMTDLTAQAGFAYWYSVRPYASGHTSWTGDVVANAAQGTFANLPATVRTNLGNGLQSAVGAPESKTLLEFRPLLPGNTQADALSLPVKVVPNPFKLDAIHSYGNSRNIRFTNVPRRARISIFSISGDLITEIIHDDITTTPPGVNNPAEVTWTQGSRSGLGQVSPGLYFYVVQSLDTGAKADGTFMIVR